MNQLPGLSELKHPIPALKYVGPPTGSIVNKGQLSAPHHFEPWSAARDRDVYPFFREHTPLKQMTRNLAAVYKNGHGSAETRAHRWTKTTQVMGAGSYGVVHSGQDRLTQRLVALKINHPNKKRFKRVQQEQKSLRLWQTIPHIVRFHGGFSLEQPLEKTLVMELTGPTLDSLLESQKRLSLADTTLLVQQLLETYKVSSEKGLVHGDLKPDNFAFNDGKVTIFDLGHAHCVEDQFCANNLQALAYRAPEVILDHLYDASVDLWSIGCIAFEAYCGKVLFGRYEDTRYGQALTMLEIVYQIGLPSPVYLVHCALRQRHFRLCGSEYKPYSGLNVIGRAAWKDQIRDLSRPETKKASELFIDLLSGIFKYENRIDADAALQLCSQILHALDHPFELEPPEENPSRCTIL